MTIESVNNDLQDLENYLENAKNKGCSESDLNIVLNVLQCPVFKNIAKNIVTVQNSLNELKRLCEKHPSIDAKNFNITTDGRLELIDVPEELNESARSNLSEEEERRFWEYVESAAKSREIVKVNLYKSQNECLGFNVVGLKAEQIENLGIFVENIAKDGIAYRQGSLQVGDQILAINREMLGNDICHKKAIEILQNARGQIELIVAKSQNESDISKQTGDRTSDSQVISSILPPVERSLNELNLSSTSINQKSDNELSKYLQNEPGLEKFSQIELIELVNSGKGLGFGILGGKSSGVVVKTILRGGVSDKDGRLKSGDHILQINNISLRGMSSEQVAQVLRTSGTNVKLLVARQKISVDSMVDQSNFSSISTTEANVELPKDQHDLSTEEETFVPEIEKSNEDEIGQEEREVSIINRSNNDNEFDEQEVESIDVELVKDEKGLGITIAGYVCEKEDISGIYVKSISPGSAADLSGKIRVNDQIIKVDGFSLLELTNHQAVEVLKRTGKSVKIRLARYLKGGKFDRLQLAINNADFNIVKPLAPTNQSIVQVDSAQASDTVNNEVVSRGDQEVVLLNMENIENYWQKRLGEQYEIVIASFAKFEKKGGLGISLEGTIERLEQDEEEKEASPHHYVESILQQGPVGLNGVLRPGDEILQVNNTIIYNMEHTEVVRLLKELPINVCMICARQKSVKRSIINLKQQDTDLQAELDEQNQFDHYISSAINQERLVKAKSDGSLAIVNTVELLSKIKSRSLEPLSGLAMWNSNPVTIELMKSDFGLGFSILDYQDPLNPNETVIVIRSLVHGGIAQQNGNLIPGDRLLAVNDISLENASLDLAVQALKGAEKGLVRLLVAKPLPISEQQPNSSNISYVNFSNSLQATKESSISQEEDAEVEQQNQNLSPKSEKSDHTRQDSDWKSVELNFEKEEYLLRKQLENLDKSYFNQDDSILINRIESNYTDGYTEIPIPTDLERLIVLHKQNQSLGVTLELSEQGINGLIVRSLLKKGLIYKDGRIQSGDNLLAINHESLRNTTTSKAKAIFKRVSLVDGEIPVKYVPECEAQCYRRNATSSFEKSKSQRSLPNFKNYCRTPSPTQKSASINPFF